MRKYKVVTNDRRSFSVAQESKYCLHYDVGSTVAAVTGSYGIMVFESLEYAYSFSGAQGSQIDDKIIEVIGIGALLMTPTHIRSCGRMHWGLQFDDAFDKFYSTEFRKRGLLYEIMPTPAGTQCYRKVEVVT